MANPRVKGYEWSLSQERHSDYNESASYAAFGQQCIAGTALEQALPGDETVVALWAEWERGVFDAEWLLLHDRNLSVGEVAERAGVGTRYIRDEIEAGRITAQKVGRDHTIDPYDFQQWVRRRENRSN